MSETIEVGFVECAESQISREDLAKKLLTNCDAVSLNRFLLQLISIQKWNSTAPYLKPRLTYMEIEPCPKMNTGE